MKKLFLIMVLATIFTQCETKKGFTITGNVTGYKDGTVVSLQSVDEARVVEQGKIEDNTFMFEGYAENAPESYMIVINDGDDSDFYSLFIGNEDVTISGDKKDFPYRVKISGAKYGAEATKLNMLTADLQAERTIVEDEFFALPEDKQLNDSISAIYWGETGKATIIDKKVDSLKTAYIKTMPNSAFALDQLRYLLHEFTKEELKTIYAGLSPELKKGRRAKAILAYASGEDIAVGKKVPGFTALDENDKSHDIYALIKKKKYTLIDFTTPHCGYCTLSIPVIKKAEEKYRAKLQVISVCIDNNKDSWQEVNDKEELPWPRLITSDGRYSKPYMQYKIHGTPAFFLVDSNGTLLHSWTGYKEDMEKEFAHLLL